MRIIAIDPGLGGAIAQYFGGEVLSWNMPKKTQDICSIILSVGVVYIEHIQPRETDKLHVSSAMKLMKNYGICLGACHAFEMDVKIIKPSVWMSGFIKAGLKYEDRKKELHKVAKKFFPKLKFKKSQADALCLLRYAMAREGVNYDE